VEASETESAYPKMQSESAKALVYKKRTRPIEDKEDKAMPYSLPQRVLPVTREDQVGSGAAAKAS
jgi:hypothetical protein